MADTILKKGQIKRGHIPFQVEGRLLQELGERLVAKPEVALVELVKNSYDADSPSCNVRLEEDGKVITVEDKGHGMCYDEFASKWMRIATSSKVGEAVSRIYRRKLTGAKGIGRFAVRYLGSKLTLISVAEDKKQKGKTRLTAHFDWPKIDAVKDINKADVDYTLELVHADTPTGTTLRIRGLKNTTEFIRTPAFRAEVLKIVTPLQGLDSGRFKTAHAESKNDPGFSVTLPGDEEKDTKELAKLVLENYWARLQIDLKVKPNILTFKVWFPSSRAPKTLTAKVKSKISAGFVADIRFFPKRKGVFQDKGIDGNIAWEWVVKNSGVAVVDRGFGVSPYGREADDWLHLDRDRARNKREWRSTIANERFSIPPAIRNIPRLTPALNLPYNRQLVGAVFVESKPASRVDDEDLTPAMDRQGFLENRAFEELADYVRAGIEFLAHQDKRELQKREETEARKAAERAREDVREAIDYISQSTTLTASDKAHISKAYIRIAGQLEEIEEYNQRARQSLITMSLLGVVAGFMTHETKSLVFEMERAADIVLSLSKKHPELKDSVDRLNRGFHAFKGQLEYTRKFVDDVRSENLQEIHAGGQIRYIVNRFKSFAEDHGINVSQTASPNAKTPPMMVAAYTGIILNLYTNALKAVLSVPSSIPNPKISIRSWNENGNHFLEVSDNGVGIPPQLRKRIWDPLYTTTSDIGNPLGSGMGLGLSLVKHVVEDSGGKIALVGEPPPGFNTCFRVTFPLGRKK